MLFSQLGAVAALCAVSQAFLLPPTISKADNELVNTLSVAHGEITDGRVLIIDCPGCPLAVSDRPAGANVLAVDSKLRFDFSIEQGEPDKLLMNGMELYPIDPLSQALSSLTVQQLVITKDGWTVADTPKLGYSMSVEHPASPAEDHLSLVTVRLEILELGQAFINAFPTIELKMVETPSGKLMIGDVETKPFVPAPSIQECSTMICKWRAIVAAKVEMMKAHMKGMKKGCHGKKPAHSVNAVAGKPVHHGKHHGHHGHRFHRHSVARFVRRIVFHVLIPILIGVLVGVTASLVGMVVGHLIVFLWRIVFRRGQQYQRVERNESSGKEDFEDLPPPVYEDAPAYTDAVENEKV